MPFRLPDCPELPQHVLRSEIQVGKECPEVAKVLGVDFWIDASDPQANEVMTKFMLWVEDMLDNYGVLIQSQIAYTTQTKQVYKNYEVQEIPPGTPHILAEKTEEKR